MQSGHGMLSPPTQGRERSSSTPPSNTRANRACEKCTRTKKKCDKGLPACSRCTRLSTKCVYDFVLPPTAAAMAEQQSLLASYMLGSGDLGISPLDLRFEVTAAQVHSVLGGQGISWREAVGRYFQTLHPWFSIVHSESFHRKLDQTQAGHPAQSSSTPGSSASSASGMGMGGDESRLHGGKAASPVEMALLFVCMYLATQWAETVENRDMFSNSVYLSAKRILALLRSYSRPSVELVQCGLLLAVYEHGHGDMMRGYTTLSECVSMGYVLQARPSKVHDEGLSLDDWEDEQMRALFWGLYVWDKICHSHSATWHLPLLMDLPADDDLLPVDNYIWDKTTRQYFKMTSKVSVGGSDQSGPLGGFQRACQAAVLIAKGVEWDRRRKRGDGSVDVDEGFADLDLRARRLIEAMVLQASRSDEFAESFAMCLSLLFSLYSGYLLCIDPSLITPSSSDVNVLKAIAGLNFAIRLVTDSMTDLDSVGPEDEVPGHSFGTSYPAPTENNLMPGYSSSPANPSFGYSSYPNPPSRRPSYNTSNSNNSNNLSASTPISTSSTPHRRVAAPSCPLSVLQAAICVHAFKTVIADAGQRMVLLRNALSFFGRRWAVSDVLMAELDNFMEGRTTTQGMMAQRDGKRYVGLSSSLSGGGGGGGRGGDGGAFSGSFRGARSSPGFAVGSGGGGGSGGSGGGGGGGISAPSPPGPIPGRSDSLSTTSSFGSVNVGHRGGGGGGGGGGGLLDLCEPCYFEEPSATSSPCRHVRNLSGVQVHVGGVDIDLDSCAGGGSSLRRANHFSDEGYGSWHGRRELGGGGRAMAEYGRLLDSPTMGGMGDYSPTSTDGGAWNGMDWTF